MARPDATIGNEFYNRFAESAFGTELATKVRYDRYRQRDISIDEWRELLGPDVNNLEHMRYTTELTAFYISKLPEGSLSEQETENLLIAASIHDQGEFFIGDITYSHKTHDDEVAELEQAIAHTREIMPGISDSDVIRVDAIRKEVVFDISTRLGKMFNTIEKMGYIQTSLKAAAHLEHNDDLSLDAKTGLQWLVADVFMNCFDANVLEVAKEDTVLASFIRNRQRAITHAVSLVGEQAFENYGDLSQPKQDKFNSAKRQWEESGYTLAA